MCGAGGLTATGDACVPRAGLVGKGKRLGWKAQGVFEFVYNPQLGSSSRSGYLRPLCKAAQVVDHCGLQVYIFSNV